MDQFLSEKEEILEAVKEEIAHHAKAATKALMDEMESERTPEQYQQ